MNVSGSGRVFYFRGRFKDSYDSTKPSSSTWITGFGKGFRVIIGVTA